jgi:hypothetical protein
VSGETVAVPVSPKLLLLIVRLPVMLPGAVGAKPTVNEKLPLAGRVVGSVGTPLSGNKVPFELTLLIVAGEELALTTWNWTALEPPTSVAGKATVPPGSTETAVCPGTE